MGWPVETSRAGQHRTIKHGSQIGDKIPPPFLLTL